ncbi:diguanylate cyclase [Marinomonas sp. RS-M-Aa-14]|uniref:sensor domain-containing diguanylate cyclase n=1 Tax=Marinomonas sp. RS-M-Aa-14 TaxID=3241169 RepID=UPI00390C7D24
MENRPETNIQLKDILEMAPIAVAWSDITSDRIDYINKSFSTLFGYSLKDLPDLNTWYDHAFPDPYYYQQVIEPWIRHNQENVPVEGLSTRMFCKDGSVKKVRISFSIVADKRLWYFNDITDYWIAEKRLRARSEMLEMVAKSSALTNILDVIVKQIQYESPLSLCSVLLFDQASQCLFLGAAPDFPDFYNKAVDGIKIDLNVGSCGTAAYLKTRVIVEDIFSHRYWQDYTALARKAGLAACWSDPIMSSKGELLGTFAIYKRIPSSPTQKELELINFASNLASIAIESFRAQEELERRAYFDHLTGLANRGHFFEQCENTLSKARTEKTSLAVLMMDVDHFKGVNDAYGHKTGDLVLQKLAEMSLSTLRKDDIIARIGGEEFAVLLPATDQDEAIRVAQRLRARIEEGGVLSIDGHKISFTVSLGVSYCKHDDCSTVNELLNAADDALYQAKAAGRNCVFSQ